MKAIKNLCALCALSMALFACEKPIFDETSSDSNEPLGNVTLTFSAHGATTRAAATSLSTSFSKLNVMLFNADGTKYFDKVRTQYSRSRCPPVSMAWWPSATRRPRVPLLRAWRWCSLRPATARS